MKFTFAFLLFILFNTTSNSQVTQQWVARYTTTGNRLDGLSHMVVDSNGNVYVTGNIEITSGSNYDFVTIKYNSSGIAQWIKTYNGPSSGEDFGRRIAVDNSGNVYVTGYSPNTGAYGTEDYATIKYNSNGIQQWVTRYNGPANQPDHPTSIAVDKNGNVYVTGTTYGANGPYYDYATIKYNSSGVQQWVQIYNGPGNQSDNAWAMLLDDSANVYVTGTSYGSGTFDDFCTIKYNTSGIQQWVTRYNGQFNNNDGAYSITLDTGRNVYVSGKQMIGSNNATSDFVTVKYNPSGVQQWAAIYNGPANDWDNGGIVAVDLTGNVYVTGSSTGVGTSYDYATIKYNSSGAQQWVQRYNGPLGDGPDYNNTLTVDRFGNVYVTGQSSASVNNPDFTSVKYSTSGIMQWVMRYNGPGNGNDMPRTIAVDVQGNVYVAGDSYGNGSGSDLAVIKYSQPTQIIQTSSEIPDYYFLCQNYPNPFNPTTTINYQLPVNSFVELTIYDVLGNVVGTLVNEKQKAGSYSVDFNATSLPSGIYFYKLVTDNFSETKKMVLIK